MDQAMRTTATLERMSTMLDVQSFVSLATASLPCRQTVVASVVSAVALRIDDPVYTTCYTRDYKGDNGRASTSRLSHEYTYHVLSATPYLQVRAFVGDIRSMYRIIMDQQTPDVQRLMEGVRLVTSPPELLMISNASEIPLVDGPAETEDAEWEKYGDVCLGDRCYLHNHLEGSEFSFKVCAKISCLRQICHRRRPSICEIREQVRLFKNGPSFTSRTAMPRTSRREARVCESVVLSQRHAQRLESRTPYHHSVHSVAKELCLGGLDSASSSLVRFVMLPCCRSVRSVTMEWPG